MIDMNRLELKLKNKVYLYNELLKRNEYLEELVLATRFNLIEDCYKRLVKTYKSDMILFALPKDKRIVLVYDKELNKYDDFKEDLSELYIKHDDLYINEKFNAITYDELNLWIK